jgi:hypothetical protein
MHNVYTPNNSLLDERKGVIINNEPILIKKENICQKYVLKEFFKNI